MWKDTHYQTATLLGKTTNYFNREIKQSTQIQLTEREIEVLQLMANGLSSKEIAETLYISIDTIESHRRNIFKKTHSPNATAAVAYGFRKKLIK